LPKKKKKMMMKMMKEMKMMKMKMKMKMKMMRACGWMHEKKLFWAGAEGCGRRTPHLAMYCLHKYQDHWY
jgi:hypothetical protein